MESFWRDVTQAVRGWIRRPGFTLVVVGTLALGIGANGAIFAVVDAVLLRPLPYPAPERLAVLWAELPGQSRFFARAAGPELMDLEERCRSFAELGAIWARPGLLRGGGGPATEVEVGWITPGFLEALGVRPQIGRLPTLEEHLVEESSVIVLSHGLWQSRYAGDPAILGRSIDFDDVPWTVVGVMPREFEMLFPPAHGVPEDLVAWLPWGGSYRETTRKFRVFTPVARLADGVSLETAAAELDAIGEQLREENVHYVQSGFALRAESLHDGVVASVRPLLLIVSGVVGLVLLIACANVGTLLLLRAAGAERELGVRSALGASRPRLVRQMLTESLMLAALGGGAGLLLAEWGLVLLRAFEPGRLPRLAAVGMEPRVIGFTLVATMATGLLFGLVAAFSALRPNQAAALRDGVTVSPGRRVQGLRRGLVVGELALSLVLLTGAGLLVRTFSNMTSVDLGFEPAESVTMRLSLPDVHYRYRDQGDKIAAFYARLDERVGALPGVEAVGAISNPPLSGFPSRPKPYAYDAPRGEVEWGSVAANYRTVTPGWFRAAGARLLSGRFLEERDARGRPNAVVVDAELARKAWPGQESLGRRIRVEVFRDGQFQPVWGEVVGIVDSICLDRIGPTQREQVFIAHAQSPQRTMNLTLRTSRDPAAIVTEIEAEAGSLEKDLPVFNVLPAQTHVSRAMAGTRFALWSMLVFAAMAALLAAAGVYAVMAYSVSQRQREIGIRVAIGATPRRILRLVVSQGLGLAGAGAAVGLAGAFLVTRLLSGLLFGVSAHDPATFAGTTFLLTGITLLACWIPARRAARVDPTRALKVE